MKSLWSLLIANALCTASLFAFIPVIGPIIRELHLAEWHSGIIVGIAGIVWMICSPLWGRYSDKVGRKHILLISMLGFALAYFVLGRFLGYVLATPLAASYMLTIFIVLRAIMGGFYAAIPPVSAARMADATTSSQRTAAMAVLGASNAIGMVIGPTLSGLVAKNNLALSLYIAAALPFIAFVLLWVSLPKSTHFVSSTNNIRIKLFDARVRLPVITSFVCLNTIITAQMLVGFLVMDRLGMDSNTAAKTADMVMGTVGITLIVTQGVMSKVSGVSNQTWIRWGVLFASVGTFWVPFATNQFILMLTYAIAAVGLGVSLPAMQAFAANVVNQDEQGSVAGAVSAAQGLAMVLTPVISTLLYGINILLPFMLAGSLLVVLSFSVTYLTRPT
ncbi:MFS transporter [Psychrobacter sp. I-STPA10]|uniref:MFS transporter n=1 Tax=Psychrobacter sp. I-STPA10 TaxID=2585769 RepID=UPI001E5A783E|nr:MFS transporter [Psychrobacter sp. I-STPA10]